MSLIRIGDQTFYFDADLDPPLEKYIKVHKRTVATISKKSAPFLDAYGSDSGKVMRIQPVLDTEYYLQSYYLIRNYHNIF